MSLKYAELAAKGVKVAALSCNALGEHQKWLDDVVAHCENKIEVRCCCMLLLHACCLKRVLC